MLISNVCFVFNTPLIGDQFLFHLFPLLAWRVSFFIFEASCVTRAELCERSLIRSIKTRLSRKG